MGFTVFMSRFLAIYSRYDWSLLLSAISLTSLGLLILFGIGMSREGHDLFQLKKQLLALGLGLTLALLFAAIDYRQLRTLAIPLYGCGALLLCIVLLIGTTHRSGGRWFSFGALSFQPIEFAKLTFILALAAIFARHAHKRLTWSALIASLVALFVYVGFVLLQPDFGSAMVLVAIWLAMVLYCGLPKNAWWILFGSFFVVTFLAWSLALKPYQRDRITSFIHPETDPYGAAYNVAQARIAVGSGGWFGKGVGEGSQARLRFLPEASTDFIFAVIGEELGFVGVSVVFGLFGFLFFRSLQIAIGATDPFAAMCLVGFLSLMAVHLVVNVGMNVGLMPVTGIPLPFISAAASSLLTMFLAIGIIESIAVKLKGRY